MTGRLIGQSSCPSGKFRAILLLVDTPPPKASAVISCGKPIGGKSQRRFAFTWNPKSGDRDEKPTTAGRWPSRTNRFLVRYPHFYPQAEPPPFGYPRRHSVHNRDGDIFVNNHSLKGKKCVMSRINASLPTPTPAPTGQGKNAVSARFS